MSVQDEIQIIGEPTALYRLYAKDGKLLYVGITHDIIVRFGQHAARKPWWPEVARKTMVWYGSRAAAFRAEAEAIRTEKPVHNMTGSARREECSRHGRRARSNRSDLADRNKAIILRLDELVRKEPQNFTLPARLPSPNGVAGDPGGPVPLYLQLADWVQAQVTSGQWEPGRRLPSERDLAEQWEVGYITIRRAMAELRERGLVVSSQGVGTFITRELPPGN